MTKLSRENAKLGLLVQWGTPHPNDGVFGIITEVSGRGMWHHQALYNDIYDSWYIVILDRSGREVIIDMDLQPDIFIINTEDIDEQTTTIHSSSSK